MKIFLVVLFSSYTFILWEASIKTLRELKYLIDVKFDFIGP